MASRDWAKTNRRMREDVIGQSKVKLQCHVTSYKYRRHLDVCRLQTSKRGGHLTIFTATNLAKNRRFQ